MIDFRTLRAADPEVAAAMEQELGRQRDHIELIASENFVSPAVMAAMGSHLTNKYAEGYPGKRYYGGCQYVDIVEDLARKRACQLFGADHAMFSRTRAHRPTLRYTSRCWSRATRYWA